jgi:hypothetical protein
MRRLAAAAVSATLLTGSCAAPSVRPVDPALPAADAGREAAVRLAVLSFLRGYADLPTAGPRALARRAGSAWMLRWVRWLDVQRRAFDGQQRGELHVGSIGPSVVVPFLEEPDVEVRRVPVEASVTFHLRPEADEPFEVTRSFRGPMLLVRTRDGDWLVTDAVRDGVPLSQAFQVIRPRVVFRADDRLVVVPDSFVATPVWQFHLQVRLRGRPAVRLRPRDARLVSAGGDVLARADVVSGSLAPLRPGRRTPAIVTFPALPSAEGVALVLRFRPRIPPLAIPLEGLIRPLPAA